ncbi:alpha/beta hydrolase [uncultured Desulfobacter sp.]|uniref:alpha/beta hydrolase n=1 Tax=uncultured Desulfobacter sp. TaxID=240139 RepID=UPI002AAA7738|nr:alpha/beta hydrolase [uncultured Desulfobacter sp.]
MEKKNASPYAALDQPQVLQFLFHPRRDDSGKEVSNTHYFIPVDQDIQIGAAFHMADPSFPNILFFHGNGEIVSDYDDFGPIFNRLGINFLVVDYRGYGRSSGSPTVSSMLLDSHTILNFVINTLKDRKFTGSLTVMGRSLGSASALELAATRQDSIDRLIIESGFAYAAPLLKTLGLDPDMIGFKETQGFGNADKIRKWNKPLLIIHALFDHIISFSQGEALYNLCPCADKKLLMIPGANHNDIFIKGFDMYLNSLKNFLMPQKF